VCVCVCVCVCGNGRRRERWKMVGRQRRWKRKRIGGSKGENTENIKGGTKEGGKRKSWWDQECKQMKRRIRMELRRWRGEEERREIQGDEK